MSLLLLEVVFLVAIFLVPGIASLMAVGDRSETRPRGVEAVFACILLSVGLTTWLGVVLVELKAFSLSLLAACLGAYVLGLTAVIWRRRGGRMRFVRGWSKAGRADLLYLVLLVAAAILYFPPFEHVLGAIDPGAYVSAGSMIAEGGGTTADDPLLRAIPEDARRHVLRPIPDSADRWYRLVGASAVEDWDKGTVSAITTFFGFPAWLAIGRQLFGLGGSLVLMPIFGLLALLAVALAARAALKSTWLGLFVGAALLLDVGQMWFSRYPMPEILTQFFIWGGIWATARYLSDRVPFWAVVGGVSFGLAGLIRLDAIVLLLIPLTVFWGVMLLGGFSFRAVLPFAIPYALLLGHAGVHIFTYSWYYVSSIADAFERGVPQVVAGLAGALVIGAALLVAAKFWRTRLIAGLRGWNSPARHLMVVAMFVVAALAYFVRPMIPMTVTPYTGEVLRTYSEGSFVRLGWYLSPLGLALAIVGFALVLLWNLNRRTALVFLFAAVSAVMYLNFEAVTPYHFWAIRRYLPVVIPAFIVAASYSLAVLWGWRLPRLDLPKKLVVVALGVGWLVGLSAGSRPVMGFVQYEGAIAQLAQLRSSLGDKQVVLFEKHDIAQRIAVPMTYSFGSNWFEVQEENPDLTSLSTVWDKWMDEGYAIYYLAVSGPPPTMPSGFRLGDGKDIDFRLADFETSLDHLPSKSGVALVKLRLYQVRRAVSNIGQR